MGGLMAVAVPLAPRTYCGGLVLKASLNPHSDSPSQKAGFVILVHKGGTGLTGVQSSPLVGSRTVGPRFEPKSF